MPCFGSKSLRNVCSRSAGLSRYSTFADESVIEAPKPSIVWYDVVGSTVIVVRSLAPRWNVTGARSCNNSARSGVVTQTWAWADGGWAWAAGPVSEAVARARATPNACVLIAAPRMKQTATGHAPLLPLSRSGSGALEC